MGRATVYCDRCGAQIASADFDKGRAESRGSKNYCPECVPLLGPPGSAAEPPPDAKKGSSRIHRPPAGEGPRDSDIIRNLHGLAGRPNTTRTTHGPAPASGPSGGMIAAVAGGIVVVLILVAVILGKGGGDKGTGGGGGTEEAARAEEAIEKCEAMRGKVSAKEWLELAARARREAAGTRHADRAAALFAEAQKAVEGAEKAEALAAELQRVLSDARGAENPAIYEAMLDDLKGRAQREAPELVGKVEDGIGAVRRMALMRDLDKVDVSFATTPHGYRRVKGELDDIVQRAGKLGGAGKTVLDAADRKRKEAEEKFGAAAQTALADLETRIGKLIAEERFEEADRDVKLFREDYKDTAISAKVEELAAKLAKAQREYDASWTKPAAADWRKDTGDATVTFNGADFIISQGSTTTSLTDTSRRLVCAKTDANWEDYEVQFEINLEKFGGAVLLRAEAADPVKVDIPASENGSSGLPPNQWITVKLKVVGTTLTLGGSIPTRTAAITAGKGTFSFVALPGGKYTVRNFRIRKIR